MPKIQLQCDYCKKYFQRYPSEVEKAKQRNHKSVFCSILCRSRGRSKKKVVCNVCGKDFIRKLTEIERSKYHYCSQGCYSKGRISDRLSPLGYIRFWDDGKYKYRHLQVMEEYLKRKLLPGECCHHKNEDRADNRIENLEVIMKSEHTRLHNNRRKDAVIKTLQNGKKQEITV